MSSEFNSCADLLNAEKYQNAINEYKECLTKGIDPLQIMLNMQSSLQQKLHQKFPEVCQDPTNLPTAGDKYEWLLSQKLAFDDEFREIVDSLAGMSRPDSERSAVWKRWKSKYAEIRGLTDDQISEADQIETKFEVIDAAHFFFNMILTFGITAEEVFAYYYIKNAENFARQERGY